MLVSETSVYLTSQMMRKLFTMVAVFLQCLQISYHINDIQKVNYHKIAFYKHCKEG